jgi:hypothetical protein
MRMNYGDMWCVLRASGLIQGVYFGKRRNGIRTELKLPDIKFEFCAEDSNDVCVKETVVCLECPIVV